MTVGICMDQKVELKGILEMVNRILPSNTDIQICRYVTEKAVFEDVQAGNFDCSLLLIDIQMVKSDGMELVSELRRVRMAVDIVFVMWSQEQIRYMNEPENASECLNVKVNRKIRRIPLNQILYMESNKRKIILHMRDGKTEFYEKMNTMEDLLKEKGFVRCHQSYIVQKQYVDEFDRNGLIVQEERIPISRKYYDHLKKMFE